MNESLSLIVWSYNQKGGNFVGVFLENTSAYSLKAAGSMTFSLVAPWAMIVDIIVLLMTNSGTQPFVLKNLACCSGTQVLKVSYSSSSI